MTTSRIIDYLSTNGVYCHFCFTRVVLLSGLAARGEDSGAHVALAIARSFAASRSAVDVSLPACRDADLSSSAAERDS
jgi:hypothetical protein